MQATLHEKPVNASTAAHQAALSRTFKVSRDPHFEDELIDVVELYLNPPEHALVLSCDEKSQTKLRKSPLAARSSATGMPRVA